MVDVCYLYAAREIVYGMRKIMGKAAVTLAKEVDGIEIDNEGNVLSVSDERIIEKLMKKYRTINVLAPMLMARCLERLLEKGLELPPNIPEEIKKWIRVDQK